MVAIIFHDNVVQEILDTNTDGLVFRLSTLHNIDLVGGFERAFGALGNYQPADEFERGQILEYSKVYIDELRARMKDATTTMELLVFLQGKMSADGKATQEVTFYTRNLLRLYSLGVDMLEGFGVNKELIKKAFL